MRIGYFIPDLKEAGEFNRCFYIAKNLVKMGHEATIIGGNPNSSWTIKTEMRQGVKLIRLPYLHPVPSQKHTSESGKVRVQPQEYLGQFLHGIFSSMISLSYDFDIVHCFSFSFPLSALAALISKVIRRHRLVIDWVDLRGREGIGRFYNRLIHSVLTFFEEKIPLYADSVTVTSDFLARHAIKIGVSSDRIFHIPAGADTDLMKPMSKDYARRQLGYDHDLQIIVYEGGSGTTQEILRQLLESFYIASLSNPKLRLVTVGCSITKSIQELVKKLNLDGKVDFIGRQPRKKIPLFLGIADLLVLPLEDDVIYRAGWPGRFGDLICSGRPILAHEVGDIAKVISKESIGLTARPNDPEDFARKIEEIISNKQLCEECGSNARRIAENKYSWRRIAEKILAIYENRLKSDWVNGELKLD